MFPRKYVVFTLFLHKWQRSSLRAHPLHFQNVTFLQELKAACAMVIKTLLFEESDGQSPVGLPEFIDEFDKFYW